MTGLTKLKRIKKEWLQFFCKCVTRVPVYPNGHLFGERRPTVSTTLSLCYKFQQEIEMNGRVREIKGVQIMILKKNVGESVRKSGAPSQFIKEVLLL